MTFPKRQKGYVVILVVVVLVIIAMLWLSTKQQKLITYFKFYEIEREVSELQLVKDRVLAFSILMPEIYQSDVTGGSFRASEEIPAVGYLPCPDSTTAPDGVADGVAEGACNPASTDDSFYGYLPQTVEGATWDGTNASDKHFTDNRFINFASKETYYYAVDKRFAFRANSASTPPFDLFAPLSLTEFEDRFGSDATLPQLTINGQGNYVAVIIDPGEDGLDNTYSNGSLNFIYDPDASVSGSDTADKVVGISYEEWLNLVVHRVCAETPRYIGSVAQYNPITETGHWFTDYDSANNKGGAGWASLLLTCSAL